MRSPYNCHKYCYGECPDCIFDGISQPEKDRELSRYRHHNSVKAKKKIGKCASILCSKADKIPKRAPHEQHVKVGQKAYIALKRSEKFKN